MYYTVYKSPVGFLHLYADTQFLKAVSYSKLDIECISNKNDILNRTILQLEEYFAGKRKIFDLPISFEGTPFQQKVWNALCSVPYGETRSYKQIADQIHCPKGCRAVGMANNKNPIAIIVPCHRIIGSNGTLIGYAGGLAIKEKLLTIEKMD